MVQGSSEPTADDLRSIGVLSLIGGIAAGAVGIAKILFFVFVVMAIAAFVFSLIKKT